MTTRADLLRAAGEALEGRDWQRAIARALGPLHPDGSREAIDDRLVRRWAVGERSIPDWVGPALTSLLTARRDECRDVIAALRQW